MRDRRKFTIIAEGNAGGHPIGTVCYEFHGHDYGCCREDTMFTGKEHITLTLNENGGGPFFTAPCDSLEPRPLGTYFAAAPKDEQPVGSIPAREPCPSCGSLEKVTEGNPEILECGQCYHAWQPSTPPATATSEPSIIDRLCSEEGVEAVLPVFRDSQPAAPAVGSTLDGVSHWMPLPKPPEQEPSR